MRNPFITSYVITLLVLLSCNSQNRIHRDNQKIDTEITTESEKVLPGFSLYEAPNQGDVPGRIFRITPQGEIYGVTTLDLPIKRDSLKMRNLADNKHVKAGFLLSFLGLKNLNLSDTFSRVREINYKLIINNGLREITEDLDIDAAVKKVTPIIIDNMKANGRESDKYYLIRESVLSNDYEMGFGKDLTGNQVLNINLTKIGTLNNGFDWNSNDSLQLKFKSSQSYRIFYKPEILTLKTGALGQTEIKRTDVYEQVY